MPLTSIGSVAAAKTIDISSYGAKGNDSVDDTIAFQKALDQAKNGSITIKVPAGKYYIGAPSGKTPRSLKIYSNTTLILDDNAVLYRQKSTPDKYIMETEPNTKQSNISISGGTWNGNVSNTKVAKGILSMDNSDNVKLSNIRFTNVCGTHFVLLNGIHGLCVDNCTFDGFKCFTDSLSNYTKQTSSTSYWSSEALHIDFIEKSSAFSGRACENVTVKNCTFKNVPSGVGTHHTYDYMTAQNIMIYNNTFTDCYYNCCNAYDFINFSFFDNTATKTPALLSGENVIGNIFNNKITARATEDYKNVSGNIYTLGIKSSDQTEISSIVIRNSSTYNTSNVNIFDNIINGSTKCGIYAYSNSKLNIHNNNISNIPYRGIYINTGNSNIYENIVSDSSDSIFVSGVSGSDITANIVSNAYGRAIVADNSNTVNIAENLIDKTNKYSKFNGTDYLGRGVVLSACTGVNNVTGNYITNSVGEGIYSIGSNINKINQNTISSSSANAIVINQLSGKPSSVASITANNIYNNSGYDLYVTGNSSVTDYSSNVTSANSIKNNGTIKKCQNNKQCSHSFNGWETKKEADCSFGTETRQCSACKTTETRHTPSKSAHKYTSSVVKPTYLANGYTNHLCSVCGSSYKDSYKSKLVLGNVGGLNTAASTVRAVKITWNKVSGADGYVVYKYNPSTKKFARVKLTKSNAYYEGNLAAGTSYKYGVRAYKTVNGKEVLSPSCSQILTSTNPSVVSFSLKSSSNKVTIKWNKLSGVTGYKIYYKTSANGKWVGLKTANNKTTSYTKTGLKKGKTYYFTVKAYRVVGGKTYNGSFVTKSVKVK